MGELISLHLFAVFEAQVLCTLPEKRFTLIKRKVIVIPPGLQGQLIYCASRCKSYNLITNYNQGKPIKVKSKLTGQKND